MFYARFDYKKFIGKKASALLLPFLTISLIALAIKMTGWWQDGLGWQQNLFGGIAMRALCRHIQWSWLQQHLRWLAELSFPIFFIHPLLTIALENIAALSMIKSFFPVPNVGTSLLVFMTVFLVQFYGAAGIAIIINVSSGYLATG